MFTNLITAAVDFNESVFRNIATVVPSEDLLDDLSDDPGARAYGEALVTRQRQGYDQYASVIGRPFTYGVSMAPDTVCSGMKGRFSDGTRFGVWYGSLAIITTVYETIFHWTRFLTDVGMEAESVITERRVFKVHASGILVDLRGKEKKFPDLVSDRYDFTHRLGDYLHRAGQRGLLVQSARDAGGTNIAAFTPDILSDPRHQLYVSYMLENGAVRLSLDTYRGKKWLDIDYVKRQGLLA
ncbi:MAG: RES family NAD+ phosphorylase [Spirochaetaceae bacterium]|nr:RES family NAD+ phosphorylase [Spirochaetaceae bacterium]